MTWKISGSGANLGKTTSVKSKGWDVQFIKGSGSFTSKVFYGSSDTGTKKPVSGGFLVSPYAIGSTVVVSGGYSGNQKVKITAREEVDYLGTAQTGKKYYRIETTNGEPVGGEGDSGSPVLDVQSDGSYIPVGLYVARGTTSIVPCNGVASSSSRKCSTIGWVTPWYKIINALDLY